MTKETKTITGYAVFEDGILIRAKGQYVMGDLFMIFDEEQTAKENFGRHFDVRPVTITY